MRESGVLAIVEWGHSERTLSVAFSPDGSQIVSGSADQTVRLWPAGTTRLLDVAAALIQRGPPLFTSEQLERFGFEGRGLAH